MIPRGRRATLGRSAVEDRECTVKKGRHRRYEEARALKRGPDLDIEGILDDLSSDRDDRPGGDPDDFDVLQADGADASPTAEATDDHVDGEFDDEIPA
jgi:hypothetical protein